MTTVYVQWKYCFLTVHCSSAVTPTGKLMMTGGDDGAEYEDGEQLPPESDSDESEDEG